MEEIRNLEYVIACYGIAAVLIGGYVLSVILRSKKVEALQRELDEQGGAHE